MKLKRLAVLGTAIALVIPPMGVARGNETGAGSGFPRNIERAMLRAYVEAVLRARGFVLGRQEFEATVKGVSTFDDAPFQKLADVGGLSTVRGYDRRTHVGNHSFAARLEYWIPYDVFAATKIPLLEDSQVQFIPWADAGRVGTGASGLPA